MKKQFQTVYQRLVAIGATIDHHESDLYVLDTPEARKVVTAWQKETGSTNGRPFASEGALWIDLPFQFDPFWVGKGATK